MIRKNYNLLASVADNASRRLAYIGVCLFALAIPAHAKTKRPPPPAQPPVQPVEAAEPPQQWGETPFEVIMRYRPTIEPGEMPAFVRATRPPEQTMDYQPLTRPVSKDPNRIGVKNAIQIESAKNALANAERQNAARAKRDFIPPAPKPQTPSLER